MCGNHATPNNHFNEHPDRPLSSLLCSATIEEHETLHTQDQTHIHIS